MKIRNLLLLALLPAALLLWPKPSAADEPVVIQGSSMKFARLMRSCRRCHLDVWDEWEHSAHSQAWTNDNFQAAIADREDKGDACARCHAPDSLLLTGPGNLPLARPADRDLGVNCVSCHMNGRSFYGPISSEGHGGIDGDPVYRESQWCASCHGQTGVAPHHEHVSSYTEAPAAEEGQTCQDCHMLAVQRQLVKSERPQRNVQPAQACRTHDFAPLKDSKGRLSGAIALESCFEKDCLCTTVRPHSGHALDLADGSTLVLRASFFDGEGAALEVLEHAFPKEGEGALLPGQATEVKTSVPTGSDRVELEIERRDSARQVLLGAEAVGRD